MRFAATPPGSTVPRKISRGLTSGWLAAVEKIVDEVIEKNQNQEKAYFNAKFKTFRIFAARRADPKIPVGILKGKISFRR